MRENYADSREMEGARVFVKTENHLQKPENRPQRPEIPAKTRESAVKTGDAYGLGRVPGSDSRTPELKKKAPDLERTRNPPTGCLRPRQNQSEREKPQSLQEKFEIFFNPRTRDEPSERHPLIARHLYYRFLLSGVCGRGFF